MAESDVTEQLEPVDRNGRRPMPAEVELDPTAGFPPHTARETSLLGELAGRPFTELVGDDSDQGDKERVLVWFALRRLGYEPSWDEAADVLIHYRTPDPTSGEQLASSPPSVTSGE